MAADETRKSNPMLSDSCEEGNHSDLSISKHKHDILLNLDNTKSGVYFDDQTPTPIRLIRNCEEVGLFQDIQNVNPFEETFRKAAEDIRTGSSTLEMPRLSVPNKTTDDESLNTPHVIYPPIPELGKSCVAPSDLPSPINPDQLCLSLDSDEPRESVVQQEADTSDDVQTIENSDLDEKEVSEASPNNGNVQFLLRMPDGKFLQLSSLPLETMQSVTASTSTPIIKINDIPAASVESHTLESVTSNACKSTLGLQIKQVDHSNQSASISLAKQRLKQALMSNACPAAVASSSTSSLNLTPPKANPIKRLVPLSNDNPVLRQAEEKRRRNRAAAVRCREKRKTWVQELERRAKEMLRTNNQLQCEVSLLRDEVAQLKTLLLAHRDCPVTQALVQGQSTQLPGVNLAATLPQESQKASETSPKGQRVSHPPAVVSSGVKPVIRLSSPPPKRKKKSSVGVSPISSVPSSVVLSAIPTTASRFVNMLPNVVLANSATTVSNLGTSQVITITNSSLGSHAVAMSGQKQAFILPAPSADMQNILRVGNVSTNTWTSNEAAKLGKRRIVSSNVIKVNPHAVDRENNDSNADIIIIDEKSAS